MTVTTDAAAPRGEADIPVGAHDLVAQPVGRFDGYLRRRCCVVIRRGDATHIAVSYDTGIR